jgi:hypothetical protein
MASQAAELAHRLARNAEAVCRHYLSNGHREGRYWIVEMSPTRQAAASMCACMGRHPANAPPANGPTPPPASMAISST